MANEWKTVTLGEAAEIVGGGTPSSKKTEYWGGNIPWITPKDLSGYSYRYIGEGSRNITTLGLAESSARLLPKNAVLMTSRAPVGYVAIAQNELATNQGFKSLILKNEFSPEFFYYLLLHNVPRIENMASGTTFKEVSANVMRQVTVNIPENKDTQKAIAHILGTLDDKIELNRRMNETLEAMAQALFKSWFVDFDPVIDKALAAGNPIPEELREKAARRAALGNKRKTLPPEIAAHFPDSFTASELGPIPEGWEVRSLADTIDLIGGGTPKTAVDDYWNGNIPWFSVVDAPSDSDVFVIDTEKHITQEGLDNSSTKLLREGSTVISARGTVGKSALIGVSMAFNQSCYGIVGYGERADIYTYYVIRSQISDLQRSGHGSVFNTITRKTFSGINICDPQSDLTKQFDKQVECLMSRIKSNLFQNHSLAQLRDTLLPKLLNGELDVSNLDIETLVEGKL